MGSEKFPQSGAIPWDKVKELRISSDSGAYSFEFEIAGKRQIMTLTVSPGQTSFTLSKPDGSPLVNATQRGREIKVLDFSTKLSLKSASPLKGMRISKKHS